MTIFRLNFLLKVAHILVCQNPSFISTCRIGSHTWLEFVVSPRPSSLLENQRLLIQIRPGIRPVTIQHSVMTNFIFKNESNNKSFILKPSNKGLVSE